MHYFPCRECDGTGAMSYPCKKCGGTGRFRKGGKDVGECRMCGGTGRFFPQWKDDGRDYSHRPVYARPYIETTLSGGTEIRAYRCKRCKGSGKTDKMASIGDAILMKIQELEASSERR